MPKTDVDTRQVLADMKTRDANNDGYLTYAEITDRNVIMSIDPTMDRKCMSS